MEIKKRRNPIISSCIEFSIVIFIVAVLAAVVFVQYILIIAIVAAALMASVSIYLMLNFRRYAIKIENGIMVVLSGVMFRNKNTIKISAHSSSVTIKTPISRIFSVVSVILFFQSGIFIIYSIDESDAKAITERMEEGIDEDKTSLFDHLL